MRRLPTLAVLALLGATGTSASAATFAIPIKNTTTFAWSSGLITLAPTIAVGPTPRSGKPYDVYGFGTSDCNPVTNDDGDATTLAKSIALTVGTNAWIVPALAAGASTTVTLVAPPGSEISYIAAVYGSGNEAADDIVMLYAGTNTSDLSVPLFDGNGLPLSTVPIQIAGYDLNSTSATNGNGGSCSPDCPVSGSGCYVAPGNGTTGELITAQPTAPSFTVGATYLQSGYTTDGLALGDLSSGTTGNEVVVIMENGQYDVSWNQTSRGRAAVLSHALTSIASFDATAAGHDFMGFPTIESLAGTTPPQFIAQEFAPLVAGAVPSSGLVYARTLSGSTTSPYFTLSNFGYPGFWNMGSSTGDVRTDKTGNELVVPSWNGEISVFQEGSATPATLNTYDFLAAHGEQIYGPVAIANVAGTSGSEIIAFGANTGTVVALTPSTTGTGMTEAWSSVPPTGASAIYAFGSGPAVGNIDTTTGVEIVVASAGKGAVYAYDPTDKTGACKYRWLTPGGFDYTWSSPVIGDVNGDGVEDIVVMSSDSVLSVLDAPTGKGTGCRDGTVVWTYTVGNGGPAWFTPALAKLSAGNTKKGYDVVVANYNTIEVVDPTNKTIAYRYSDPAAQFFPSAVIDAPAGSTPSVFVSGWANGKVYRLDAPAGTATNGTAWPSFMGANTRIGAR